ncbi:hemolysin XhlA family protein, partial [Bacillus vallismortis]|nr:hemolysin XhlA family protein [Bacillus vallismortis]
MQHEVDVNVFQQDLTDIKGEHKALEQRVSVVERVSDRQDQQIMTLNEKLNKIDEKTTWIKRTITGAM